MQQDYSNCTFCQKTFTGIECYKQHIESAKHKKKVQSCVFNSKEQLQFYICNTCDVCCSGSIPYKQHLRSEKHLKKIGLKHCLGVSKEDPYVSHMYDHTESQEIENKTNALHFVNNDCSSDKETLILSSGELDCNVTRNTDSFAHFFSCSVCDKQFNGPIPYRLHLSSENHKKMLTKKENGKQAILQSSADICNKGAEQHVKMEVSDNEDILCNLDGTFRSRSKREKGATSETGNEYQYCSLCDMHFTGKECALQHYKGKHHKKEMSLRLGNRYVADTNLCIDDLECRSEEIMDYEVMASRLLFQQKIKLVYEYEPFEL